MDAKTVKETFKNLPKKRKQVLLRVLAGYSKPKIAYELCNGSETAVQQNLRQLYKNFHIRGDRERNLPALISLFARCMPELLSDRIPEVLDDAEQEEVLTEPPKESSKVVIAANRDWVTRFIKTIQQVSGYGGTSLLAAHLKELKKYTRYENRDLVIVSLRELKEISFPEVQKLIDSFLEDF